MSNYSHKVKEGESIGTIAKQYGFYWETLWDHESNLNLREKRQNPFFLRSGDIVVIPEKKNMHVKGDTDKRHVFRLKGVPASENEFTFSF